MTRIERQVFTASLPPLAGAPQLETFQLIITGASGWSGEGDRPSVVCEYKGSSDSPNASQAQQKSAAAALWTVLSTSPLTATYYNSRGKTVFTEEIAVGGVLESAFLGLLGYQCQEVSQYQATLAGRVLADEKPEARVLLEAIHARRAGLGLLMSLAFPTGTAGEMQEALRAGLALAFAQKLQALPIDTQPDGYAAAVQEVVSDHFSQGPVESGDSLEGDLAAALKSLTGPVDTFAKTTERALREAQEVTRLLMYLDGEDFDEHTLGEVMDRNYTGDHWLTKLRRQGGDPRWYQSVAQHWHEHSYTSAGLPQALDLDHLLDLKKVFARPLDVGFEVEFETSDPTPV